MRCPPKMINLLQLAAEKKTSFLWASQTKIRNSYFVRALELKFKYPEKVAKILCNLHVIVLMLLDSVKSKRKIFVAFSENLKFTDLSTVQWIPPITWFLLLLLQREVALVQCTQLTRWTNKMKGLKYFADFFVLVALFPISL